MKVFQFLRNRSIRTKLIILASLSGFLALLLASTVFILNDLSRLRESQNKQLQTQAELLAYNSAAALQSHDARTAQQFLDSLKQQPTAVSGALYDASGNMLAEYRAKPTIELPSAASWQSDPHANAADRLQVHLPVLHEGQRVGSIYLSATDDDFQAQMWEYIRSAGLVMAYSVAVSILISYVLQRGLSRPILQLSQVAKSITKRGDYSLRVHHDSRDEIGALYQSFNEMLAQVESSKRALRQARDELEIRVLDRTAQLTQEIAERERVQADLVHAKDAAEAANRAKSEFLANMSHEIRTPLNAILGFSDLLRRGADETADERQDFLDTVHRSGKHLLDLINDILDLSKIEAGQMQVEQLRCSPYQIISEVASLMRVRAKEKGLSLDYNWCDRVPETIVTDPARLRQLLLNLVGNAIKFTACGGVQIIARLLDEQSEPRLQIQVIDTGIGIPADKQSMIFDPFSQADSSVTRRFGGTGLGLAICRHIAQALGGEIDVESKPGHGSIFTVTLATGSLQGIALLEGPASDIMPPKRNVQAADRITSLPDLRILVVEDGETNRKLIHLLLTRAGARVVTAENGKAGLELALYEDFDLVLMDMQMGVMDGYTAVAQLRALGVTTPVIALTAHAMKDDEQKCLAAGCSGYLTKPIDADRLMSVIQAEFSGRPPHDAPAVAPPANRSPQPLMSTLPADDADFQAIVAEFVERLDEKMADMQAAVRHQDWDTLSQLAHWLKGSGGSAGFQALTDAASVLELALREGGETRISAAFQKLGALCSRIPKPLAAFSSATRDVPTEQRIFPREASLVPA